MNWNCPHCETLLAINAAQIGSGWHFSKCTKCNGFALIRRSEINVIKVDQAPPGERVLMPERSMDTNINHVPQEPTEKFSQAFVRIDEKSDFNSGKRLMEEMPHAYSPSKSENHSQSSQSKLVTVGIVSVAFLALVSGANLLFHGKPFFTMTRDSASKSTEEEADTQLTARQTIHRSKGVLTDSVQESAMAPVPAEQEIMLKNQERISTTQSTLPTAPTETAQSAPALRTVRPQIGVTRNIGYRLQRGRFAPVSANSVPAALTLSNQATRPAPSNLGEAKLPAKNPLN